MTLNGPMTVITRYLTRHHGGAKCACLLYDTIWNANVWRVLRSRRVHVQPAD